jgi:hypothetical protein
MNGEAQRRPFWLTHTLAGCVGVVVGAAVVFLHGQGSPTGEPRLSTEVDAGALERDIRHAVREELTRHRHLVAAASVTPVAPQAEPTTSATPTASAGVSSEVLAQTARADAVLAAAAARLVWTDEDARDFRNAIAGLPPSERQEILLKFAQAVNDGGLRLETDAAPF